MKRVYQRSAESRGFSPGKKLTGWVRINIDLYQLFPAVRSLNRNTMHCGKQLGDLLTLDFYEAYAPPRFTRTV